MKTPWSDRAWRRTLVYGLGLSGVAASRLLRCQGVEVLGVDDRPAAELELAELVSDPGFELLTGDEPKNLPVGIDAVVVSPGVPGGRPLLQAAQRAGLPVIAEVELAFPLLAGPLVAITGSNGKSTTTALTGELLRAAGFAVEVCGNIGRPLSACVGGPQGRVFVAELSSFQLERVITLRPRAAALLNLSPDHLDRHPDMAAYAAAKSRIFARQGAEDLAVLNADDPQVAAVATAARRRFFSRLAPVADGCYLADDRVLEVTPGEPRSELFRAAEVRIAGAHNLENAMAAALLARALGAPPAAVRAGLASFRGLPHRLQAVARIGGVTWYDDSKGTNVGATLKSIEGFADGTLHLILGGRGKGTDYATLAAAVARKARRVYLVGEAAAELDRVLGSRVACERCGELGRAVAAAAASARPGEAVVLSPACASFDQYRNFVERGEHFQRLVRALAGGADGEEARL